MVAAMGIADSNSFRSPIDGHIWYGRDGFNKHNKQHGVLPQSELKGEAAYQKKQHEIADKRDRKKAIVDAVMQHTN